MRELKNCPNCGGVLNDEGRCMYCKSKIYDLTGMKIDLDTRDTVLLKFKYQGMDIIYKAFPVTVSIETSMAEINPFSDNRIMIPTPDVRLNLEFRAVPYINKDNQEIVCEAYGVEDNE